MKTKLLLSALFSFFFYLLSSQAPQGFNYQAIARDGSGNPIVGATIKVKLSILSDTLGFRAGTGGVYVWEEEHTGVVTNAYGLFTIVLGDPSATYVQGVAGFSLIDWNKPNLFLGTKIANPTTYKVLGGAKLWSVPYSLVAGELGGTVDKIKVKGTEVEPDSALFEVKNKNGQIVFAVYNEGVRVYVDDGVKGITKGGFAIGGFGTDKGTSQNYFTVSRDSIRAYVNDTISKGITKGGFAIGGFGTDKALKQEYFRVTRDSTRIYVNDLTGKGITKGGFAIGGFGTEKGGNANFFNIETGSTKIINPPENRILWYPIKNAFLAGNVLIEHPDSVGINSFSSGYLSRAIGSYSQALGYQATARGWGSTAIGYNSVANGQSFAFGAFSKADIRSFAIGIKAIAVGYNSFSMGGEIYGLPGTKSNATGECSMAIGFDSQAYGKRSLAIGISDSTFGQYSFSLGYKTSAKSDFSTAIGIESVANGMRSVSMGYRTYTGGEYSIAMGYFTKATGSYSMAYGNRSEASGLSSTAMGYYTVASGSVSTALGVNTTASGQYSTAMGYNSVASGAGSTALGWSTTAYSGYELVLGGYNTSYIPLSSLGWNPADRLFVIGNGSGSSSTSNAMTVLKNGRVGLTSVTTPTYALELPNNTDNGIGKARANAWATYSDRRTKSGFENISYGLAEIMLLTPLSYLHHNTTDNKKPGGISAEGKRDIGLIAQEVYNVIPEAVFRPEDEGSDLWSMSYDKLVPVLIKGIQEQQHQIEIQQKEIDELKALVNTLIANQSGKSNK